MEVEIFNISPENDVGVICQTITVSQRKFVLIWDNKSQLEDQNIFRNKCFQVSDGNIMIPRGNKSQLEDQNFFRNKCFQVSDGNIMIPR